MEGRVLLGILVTLVLVTIATGQGIKPGQCPDIEDEGGVNCTEECESDHDCLGEMVCCPGSDGGCNTYCVHPTDALPNSVTVTQYGLLGCEGTVAELVCNTGYLIRVAGVFWGRGDSETCGEEEDNYYYQDQNETDVVTADERNDVRCSGRAAGLLLGNLCNGRKTCRAPASIGYFGDPCASPTRKYLKAEFYCEQQTYRVEVCENSGKIPLSCPDNKLITAESAFYGRWNYDTCPHATAATSDNCTSATAGQIFYELCDGRNQCELDARREIFGDPCPGNFKYLHAEYSCSECANDYGNDALCELWALQGQCTTNREWMIPNCRKACWNCDDEPPVCWNHHYNTTECDIWAAEGDCAGSMWMQVFCRMSCQNCNQLTPCDKNYYDEDYGGENCDRWLTEGQCSANMHYMFWDCTNSCFGCANDTAIRCENKYFDSDQCDQWAAEGECERNPGYMIGSCFKSCMGCTADPICENTYGDDLQCNQWERDGECTTNPIFMHKQCWKSCIKCYGAPVCQNRHGNDAECDTWRSLGECDRNPRFMMQNCSKSCTKCGKDVGVRECVNIEGDSACDYWASIEECSNNPGWMIRSCRKSCTLCDFRNLDLAYVGVSPGPGTVNEVTKDMSFVMPGAFPYIGRLTHFMAFFASADPVDFNVWRPVTLSDGSIDYTEAYTHRAYPSGVGYVQTFMPDRCLVVLEGDKIGFSAVGNRPSPIGYVFDIGSVSLATSFRVRVSQSRFVTMGYPYKFFLGAGYIPYTSC